MMGQVVRAERSRVGNADGQVRNDGEESVGYWRAECKVVRYLVDGKEEVLVRGGPDDIRKTPDGNGEEGRRSEKICAEDLEKDDSKDYKFGQWFGAAQLGDLYSDGQLIF